VETTLVTRRDDTLPLARLVAVDAHRLDRFRTPVRRVSSTSAFSLRGSQRGSKSVDVLALAALHDAASLRDADGVTSTTSLLHQSTEWHAAVKVRSFTRHSPTPRRTADILLTIR